MPELDPAAYPPAFADLLRLLPLAPLGPGSPDLSVRDRLQSLDDATFGTPIVDRSMADACRAGLWLAFNFFDEAHTISQDIETPTCSYWHGILHRREPDFGNAKYWFRRVGAHPIFGPLRADAVQFAAGATLGQRNQSPLGFGGGGRNSAKKSLHAGFSRQMPHS